MMGSPQGQPTTPETTGHEYVDITNYLIKLAYSGNNVEFVGKAEPGSATSAAVWQIMKLTYSGNNVTDVEWADGNLNFDNVWDNRAGLSYS